MSAACEGDDPHGGGLGHGEHYGECLIDLRHGSGTRGHQKGGHYEHDSRADARGSESDD